MHILLTDTLTCPRCGPEFGLILLADEMRDRTVVEGHLGCPNCRESYPIAAGVVDASGSAGEAVQPGGEVAPADVSEAAYRVAALLGVGDQPAPVLLVGLPVAVAGAVAGLLAEARVAATAPGEETGALPDGPSWLRHGTRLPFRSGSQRGVALAGERAGELLGEAVRVLQRGGRLVLDPAPAGAAERLTELGLELLLEQEGVVVASLGGAR